MFFLTTLRLLLLRRTYRSKWVSLRANRFEMLTKSMWFNFY